MRFIPVAAVLLICLLPSFVYANTEGSGLKTIYQVLLEYEDQYRTKAWFKITSSDGECFNAAYKLYQESTNKTGERVRDGYGSGEDAYKNKAATFFLARVIAQKYFPIERIVQLSEKEKASDRKFQTLEALSLLQANRALACSIDYAVSQKYTEPQDIYGAIQLLSNNGNEKNIENLEKEWKKSRILKSIKT